MSIDSVTFVTLNKPIPDISNPINDMETHYLFAEHPILCCF